MQQLTISEIGELVDEIGKLSQKDILDYQNLIFDQYDTHFVNVYGEAAAGNKDQGPDFVRRLMGKLNTIPALIYLKGSNNRVFAEIRRVNTQLRCNQLRVLVGIIPPPPPPPPPPGGGDDSLTGG